MGPAVSWTYLRFDFSHAEMFFPLVSGCSSVWLEHWIRDPEVAGSIPVAPTTPFGSEMFFVYAREALRSEHWAVNPGVEGSTPSPSDTPFYNGVRM